MQQPFLVKYSRQITIFSLIGIIFCIILIICTSLHHEFSKKTYLSVQLAPSSAVLTLDNSGKELRTGTYELPPGHYTGTISADSFTPKTIEFDVEPRQSNSLNEYIIHTKEGLSFFEKSAANISILRQIKDDQDVTNFLDAYDYKTSIYDKLPLYSIFTNARPTSTAITDGRNDSRCLSTLCLLTTEEDSALSDTKQTLTDSSYNYNDYDIIMDNNL